MSRALGMLSMEAVCTEDSRTRSDTSIHFTNLGWVEVNLGCGELVSLCRIAVCAYVRARMRACVYLFVCVYSYVCAGL